MMCLTLGIAHKVIKHAARTAHARYAFKAGTKAVGRKLTGASTIPFDIVKLLTIATAYQLLTGLQRFLRLLLLLMMMLL